MDEAHVSGRLSIMASCLELLPWVENLAEQIITDRKIQRSLHIIETTEQNCGTLKDDMQALNPNFIFLFNNNKKTPLNALKMVLM